MRFFYFIFLLLLFPGTAQAAWLRASSAHFVVYADSDERTARRFSDQLERYHAAMAFVTGHDTVTPSPSNRVTVYVVSSEREVKRLYGEGSQYVSGFYVPSAGGSVAIVPRTRGGGKQLDFSMIVLLHEYAHHFLISTSSFPVPRWMSEGGAEFFASASFGSDGSIGVGQPAMHRAGELFHARDVTAAELLDPDTYEKRKRNSYDAFYGKSWLLYHYLAFNQERTGQLGRYLRLMMAGKSSRDAALEAFGDFGALDRELDSYLRKPRMLAFKLSRSTLKVGPVEVTRLSEGHGAMMPIQIRSRRGVDEKEAAALVVEARAIAARYPGDAAVLAALAEAEYDAGNDKEAVAAADAAIAANPAEVNAYVQKGYALFRIARDSDHPDAFKQARAPFIALNKLENDHPLPLVYYYRSFTEQGLTPPPIAVQGLARAVELAPFDLGLRMNLALQQIRDKRFDQARRNLAPVAYNPHGGEMAGAAHAMLTRLDRDPDWNGADAPGLPDK